jgi:hypothetical protein
MGRKSRRKAKLRAAARQAQGLPAQPVHQARPMPTQMARPAAESRAVAAPIQSGALSSQVNRYQYVPAEMRQIGIIAGVLFLILFVLAFVLH